MRKKKRKNYVARVILDDFIIRGTNWLIFATHDSTIKAISRICIMQLNGMRNKKSEKEEIKKKGIEQKTKKQTTSKVEQIFMAGLLNFRTSQCPPVRRNGTAGSSQDNQSEFGSSLVSR